MHKKFENLERGHPQRPKSIRCQGDGDEPQCERAIEKKHPDLSLMKGFLILNDRRCKPIDENQRGGQALCKTPTPRGEGARDQRSDRVRRLHW